MRVEDTDLERSTRQSEEAMIRDLKWLGLDWDEGLAQPSENLFFLRESKIIHSLENAENAFEFREGALSF